MIKELALGTVGERNRTHMVFINGSFQSGKSSIAFQVAYEEASFGGIPLFICQKNKFQQHFPKPCQHFASESSEEMMLEGNSFNPAVLSRIYMKYVENAQDLLTLLTGIQKFQPLPSLVVIDDLSSFLPSISQQNSDVATLPRFHYQQNYTSVDQRMDFYLLLLAMIDDTARYVSHGTMFLIVDHVEDKSMIHMIKRYMDDIISLIKVGDRVELKRLIHKRGESMGDGSNGLLDCEEELIGYSRIHNNAVICLEKGKDPY